MPRRMLRHGLDYAARAWRDSLCLCRYLALRAARSVSGLCSVRDLRWREGVRGHRPRVSGLRSGLGRTSRDEGGNGGRARRKGNAGQGRVEMRTTRRNGVSGVSR